MKMIKHSISILMASSMIWMIGCSGKAQSSTASAPNGAKDGAVWLTDFEKAKTGAAEKKRPVLMNFTGSDWCPPCIQLKKDILGTKEFAQYAEENLVLLELDFPQRTPQPEAVKKQNKELGETFQIEGFPTLVLLSPEGVEIARNVGYMPGVKLLKDWLLAGERIGSLEALWPKNRRNWGIWCQNFRFHSSESYFSRTSEWQAGMA
jgi:thioredoxin-related protein